MEWSDRVGRRLKTRDLHVFLAVAEKGNMAKAAEQLAYRGLWFRKPLPIWSTRSVYACSTARRAALNRLSMAAPCSSAVSPYSTSFAKA
jgi:hypothetical protein